MDSRIYSLFITFITFHAIHSQNEFALFERERATGFIPQKGGCILRQCVSPGAVFLDSVPQETVFLDSVPQGAVLLDSVSHQGLYS